jgi:hypothetical protein
MQVLRNGRNTKHKNNETKFRETAHGDGIVFYRLAFTPNGESLYKFGDE